MCDTLCHRTGAGMLFAKSSDRHPDEAQVAEWHAGRAGQNTLRTQYLTIPDAPAYAFLGSRPTWLWGVEHGVNEHGVAIGNEKIWTIDRPQDLPPALLGMDLVRLALERGRNADDALDVVTSHLERFGQGGSGEPHHDEPYFSSFLIVDPRGGWIVETSGRTWVAEPVTAGAAISNRVCVRTSWASASANVPPGSDFDAFRLADMPTGVADHRLAVTRAAVDAATTPELLANVLRSHGPGRGDDVLPGAIEDDWSGFTVCMHRRDADAQTTASLIAELRDDERQRAWICLGNPCTGVYVPVFPPAVAPQLADARQWRRFARLRDRVEARRDEMPDVRKTLASVEAELWEKAANLFASGSRARLTDFAATAFAPVDAALHRLGV